MMCLNKILQISFMYTFFIVHTSSETSTILDPIRTNFSCLDKTAGFYADINARCKIYHTCDEYGNKFTYRCPEETAFRQDALICDHAHLVDCKQTNSFHVENVKNKYNDSSCIKGFMNNNNCEYIFQSTRDTQFRKPDSVVQHGFTLNLHKLLKNVNEGNISRDNTMKSFSTQTQKFQNQQVGPRTNEHFSVISQTSNNKNKINEKKESNQEDHFNKKTNITLNNFLKLPGQTLFKTIQDQQSNRNNNQIAKTSNTSFDNNRNHPYIETLNSIQKSTKVPSPEINAITANTTEIPIYALTLSLKPLIPRELEDDPYYPKFTSTESYYTPSHNKNLPRVEASSQSTWSNTHIEFPSALPDLRSLEDIVDRRKLLYIPRIKFN